jgi:HAD superfamily hydrolase (TIGR01484 family)
MTSIRVVEFDLDDTLAESKSPISSDMGDALANLLTKVPVCIISGGRFEQFDSQVLRRLPARTPLARLHLMPTCGTRYLRYTDGGWREVYSHDLSAWQKAEIVAALEKSARELGLWENDSVVTGPRIEDRGSQITYSALGQLAQVSKKREWDPSGSKRELLRARVAELLPTFEVRSGGSTSIDVTQHGIDKAYGTSKLMEMLSVDPDELLFVGDRLEPGGNDYPVVQLGVRCHSVEGPADTLAYIDELMAITE